MNITNATQFYHFLAKYQLIDQIPNGRSFMGCMDEYQYNCNCTNQSDKNAVYGRCNAIYEEIVRGLGPTQINTIFQKVDKISISFNWEKGNIRSIAR